MGKRSGLDQREGLLLFPCVACLAFSKATTFCGSHNGEIKELAIDIFVIRQLWCAAGAAVIGRPSIPRPPRSVKCRESFVVVRDQILPQMTLSTAQNIYSIHSFSRI